METKLTHLVTRSTVRTFLKTGAPRAKTTTKLYAQLHNLEHYPPSRIISPSIYLGEKAAFKANSLPDCLGDPALYFKFPDIVGKLTGKSTGKSDPKVAGKPGDPKKRKKTRLGNVITVAPKCPVAKKKGEEKVDAKQPPPIMAKATGAAQIDAKAATTEAAPAQDASAAPVQGKEGAPAKSPSVGSTPCPAPPATTEPATSTPAAAASDSCGSDKPKCPPPKPPCPPPPPACPPPPPPKDKKNPCSKGNDDPCGKKKEEDPCAKKKEEDPCAKKKEEDPCAKKKEEDPCAKKKENPCKK